jgi:hypothetical protein
MATIKEQTAQLDQTVEGDNVRVRGSTKTHVHRLLRASRRPDNSATLSNLWTQVWTEHFEYEIEEADLLNALTKQAEITYRTCVK